MSVSQIQILLPAPSAIVPHPLSPARQPGAVPAALSATGSKRIAQDYQAVEYDFAPELPEGESLAHGNQPDL